MESIHTLDTLSVLENKYAKSESSVSNGALSHSLAAKPVSEPVEIEEQIVYRDSLVYVDKIMTETVETKKSLSSGDRFFLALGKWPFAILMLYGSWRLFKLLYLNKLK